MRVLISLLGLAPGVATGAYYALARDRDIPIDRLVTLTTLHPQAGDCEREIERELQRWRDEQGISIQYDGLAILYEPEPDGDWRAYRQSLKEQMTPACRLRIPYDDLNTESSVAAFREAVLTLVRDVYRDDEVYLCVAGGRKSMSAVAAIAAQLYGHSVKGLYHLFVQEDIEDDGEINNLSYLSPDRKQRVLRPEPGEVRLVELPFFQIIANGRGLQVALHGQVQDYILDYLADNPELVTVLEPDSHEGVLNYVFEVQVCDHLRRQGWTVTQGKRLVGFKPDKPGDKGETDVYAERGDEVLICECTMLEDSTRPVRAHKVQQAIDRLEFLRACESKGSKRKVVAWVVSPGHWLQDVNQWDRIRTYGGNLLIMRSPLKEKVLRHIKERTWMALLRETWFDGEFQVVQESCSQDRN